MRDSRRERGYRRGRSLTSFLLPQEIIGVKERKGEFEPGTLTLGRTMVRSLLGLVFIFVHRFLKGRLMSIDSGVPQHVRLEDGAEDARKVGCQV